MAAEPEKYSDYFGLPVATRSKQHIRRRCYRGVALVAAKEFRRRGIAGFGVGEVMRGAGLTQGAFYGHFPSKEALVREALHESMKGSPVIQRGKEGKTLKEMVDLYLEADHRDHPEAGCPAPLLVEEVARHPKRTREAFISDLQEMIALIEAHLPKNRTSVARQKIALAIFSTMLGALQLARVTTDSHLSNRILEAGKEAALALAKE